MPATLAQTLLAPETRPHVVADCVTLIDQEVADKSGVSGAAVKLAYKTVTSFASGYLRSAVDSLLPQITERLEPYWTDFAASGGSRFGDYLAKRGDEVTQSVLSVTDARAERSTGPPSSRPTARCAAARPGTWRRPCRRSATWCRSTRPDWPGPAAGR